MTPQGNQPSTTFSLKCANYIFPHIASCGKTFEFRLNDRDFKVGGILIIRDYDHDKGEYSGRIAVRRITYILYSGFGIPDGYCVMSIEPCCFSVNKSRN